MKCAHNFSTFQRLDTLHSQDKLLVVFTAYEALLNNQSRSGAAAEDVEDICYGIVSVLGE